MTRRPRTAIIGPVYPYRAGIAHCTTRLAEELAAHHDVAIVSYKRQFPRLFYPGGDDVDPSLVEKTPSSATFDLDVMNPLSWIRAGRRLAKAKPDAVVFVWWVWVWALPYWLIRRFLPRETIVVVQCHNVGHKEPAGWKNRLTDLVLRGGDLLVVHAGSERDEAIARLGPSVESRIRKTFLPAHEMGGDTPDRDEARRRLGIEAPKVALFFGHVRPFKGLDLALQAWSRLDLDVLLLVGGEVWWSDEERHRTMARELGIEGRVRFDFRFIPDSELADWFGAADVVVAPYRAEAQSGVAMTSFHHSRPVIATTVGGFPELIEEGVNGLLIPPEDPAALAAAASRFFRECDRPAMEAAARDTATRLSWSEYARQLAAWIEE